MRKRTIVARMAVHAIAGKAKARQFLAQVDADHEEAFVIDEIGVVARLVFFNQLPLQQQCLRLGFNE